jgi:hypothetical protein
MGALRSEADSRLEQALRGPVDQIALCLSALAVVALLLAIVGRLSGAMGSVQPGRALVMPVLLAGVGASLQPVVLSLGEGMLGLATEMRGFGTEASEVLAEKRGAWLPQGSALQEGVAASTRPSSWVNDLWGEIEDGGGLTPAGEASLWHLSEFGARARWVYAGGLAAGFGITAASVGEVWAGALHRWVLELLGASAPAACALLLFPPLAAAGRRILLQAFAVCAWPVGWALAHAAGLSLIGLSEVWLLGGAAAAVPGELLDMGAHIETSQWGVGVLGVWLGVGLIGLALPGVPALGIWLLSGPQGQPCGKGDA